MTLRLFLQTMLARRMLAVVLATSTALALAVALLTSLNRPLEALAREGTGNPHGLGRPATVAPASFQPSSVMTLTGEITGTGFGFPVATAGDVNGDGYDDVIVGAHGYLSYTGRAYVFLGSGSGLNPTPAFTATGEVVNSFFGFAAGMAGDVNGDGYADVIIGA
ncbi:MAG TPA: integrin alpha, partial [Anaerolineales bacterium]|nr:integrin alpha [Anaerolineales bacterium]